MQWQSKCRGDFRFTLTKTQFFEGDCVVNSNAHRTDAPGNGMLVCWPELQFRVAVVGVAASAKFPSLTMAAPFPSYRPFLHQACQFGHYPPMPISKPIQPCVAPPLMDKLGGSSGERGAAAGRAPAAVGTDGPASPSWNNGNFVFPPLKYTDWGSLQKNRRWLQPHIGKSLESIDSRIKEWPKRFAREKHQYRENACLIAMSEFEQASAFCNCCRIGSSRNKFSPGRCKVWKLCPYCSHKKRLEILRKYLPVFRRGKWWFLTISPVELCNLNILTVQCFIDWWEACRYALDTLVKAGVIKGAFILETISVHAYWPVAEALPHDHVVVLADTVTPSFVDELHRLIASYHGQSWNPKKRKWMEPEIPRPIWSVASTRTYTIKRDFDFASVLSYLCNPVNLAAAYMQDWSKVAGNNRQSSDFNENFVEAVEALCAAWQGRWGHRYYGALQHAHRNFTGIEKSIREKKSSREAVKQMLEECQLKRMNEFDSDNLGTPVEFEECGPVRQ